MKESPRSWQDLQFFLAAARGGSLAAAAHALGVSSATVHRRLAHLERVYATRLFDRSPRGYALTEAGQELHAHVERIEAEMLSAERRVGGRDRRLRGRLHVATVDDLALTVLGPVLRGFAGHHSQLEIELSIGSDHSDLSRRHADVAIRPGSRPPEGDLVARRVCGIGVALYGRRELADRTPAPASLPKGQRVVRGDAARAGLPMERWLDRQAPCGQAALRSGSMLARLVAVREGLGVGLLPCLAADADPGLVRLSDLLPEAGSSLWILTHADMRRNARVGAFVAHAQQALAALAPKFEGETRTGAQA